MKSGWAFENGDASTPDSTAADTDDFDPEEVAERMFDHQAHGNDFKRLARGEWSKTKWDGVTDSGKAALLLFNDIRAALGSPEMDDITEKDRAWSVMEYFAERWPENELGRPRVWTRQEDLPGDGDGSYIGKFEALKNLLYSQETKPDSYWSDPLDDRYRRQVELKAQRTWDSIDDAFWVDYTRNGYATVSAIASHDHIEVTKQWIRKKLDERVENGMLEKIDEPDPDDGRGNPQAYILEDEGEEPSDSKKLVTDGGVDVDESDGGFSVADADPLNPGESIYLQIPYFMTEEVKKHDRLCSRSRHPSGNSGLHRRFILRSRVKCGQWIEKGLYSGRH